MTPITRRLLLGFAALAMLVAGLYLWRRLGSDVVTAHVARARVGSLVQSFRTNGVVEPREFQEIRAEFPTRVLAVLVTEGEPVRAGQPLARLDDRDLQAALAQAQAQLLGAEQELARLRSAGPLADLGNQLTQAEADLDLATSVYGRSKILLEQKAISQLEFDESAAAYRKAADHLAALEKQRDTQSRELVPLAEREARSRAEHARVLVANATSRLGFANVPSPMAGTVLVKPPRPGTVINPGDLLAKVGDLEFLQVRAYIDQPDFSSVQVGSPVKITSTGFPGESWDGAVKRLSAELTTIGRRVVGEATCAITSGGKRLPVNSNVDLVFTSRELNGVLLVPVDSVFQLEGRDYVYVVRDGQLVLREVQVGASNAEAIVIRGGLRENEVVLNDLEVRPQEGLRINPQESGGAGK